MTLVTVHIPFKGHNADLIECVDSILKQTFQDFRIIIVGDGVPVPVIDDPRVFAFELAENRGAYFARSVMVEATETRYSAIIDADDWVDPEWLEKLVQIAEETGADAVLHSSWIQHITKSRKKLVKRDTTIIPSQAFRDLTSHTGLYRTNSLKRVGYNPGYRMGWDTLLVLVFRLVFKVRFLPEPLYHRQIRKDSLTRSPGTMLGSPERIAVRDQLIEIWAKVWVARRSRATVFREIKKTFPRHLFHEVQRTARKVSALW